MTRGEATDAVYRAAYSRTWTALQTPGADAQDVLDATPPGGPWTGVLVGAEVRAAWRSGATAAVIDASRVAT